MSDTSQNRQRLMTLHLTVNNHPGVMSHVCGLFARRAFNLEGILVTPVNGGNICNMWLLVNEDERMEQIISQVRKLHDVLNLQAFETESGTFERMASCFEQPAPRQSSCLSSEACF